MFQYTLNCFLLCQLVLTHRFKLIEKNRQVLCFYDHNAVLISIWFFARVVLPQNLDDTARVILLFCFEYISGPIERSEDVDVPEPVAEKKSRRFLDRQRQL